MPGMTTIRGNLRPAMSGNMIGRNVTSKSGQRVIMPVPPNRIPSSITNRKKGKS
jgi:hypothetical protein